MNQVYQGGQYTARAIFTTSAGVLTDPVGPKVSVHNPSGDALFTAQDLTRDDTGQYHITFMVPTDADVGTWTTTYTGTINGDPVALTEEFAVLDSGAVTAQQGLITRIRLALGEKIPVGGDEADTRFTDSDIVNALYYNAGDFNKTMAEMWLAKAGMWAELPDYAESGTTRQFSQMGRAALNQAKIYIDKVTSDDTLWTSTYRVVGESFDAFGQIPRPRWLWEPVTVRG